MNNQKIISPCNNICKLDNYSSICIGCGRTSEEITNWIFYSDEKRVEIMNSLTQRLGNYKSFQQDGKR
ncbi:MAG: DUF1289 domain-containing protein [Melioribacteraceae bacterium]|nr:DUF1289 domain-containing protein [Melioribacteraceae bacterium]